MVRPDDLLLPSRSAPVWGLHLPRRGLAPSPRWTLFGGWAAGARRTGLSGGRAAVGGRRGGEWTTLWGGGR